ncbi:hypothetical protein [Planctomyces sp. SH-PL14]|uniref:hypothetical protein n=1 Tax=Planctomyces sp. SH-PL14 TaxID=1632864 RepID=UPI00078D568B|nr:hypothetical protein [Planctomyces sp. SH-PL14]AMV22600.1 hypothetical protein VT03_32190 [Planctomyces sp. SH-PL14]
MTDECHDILDDLFHGCAFAAYVELAVACRGIPDEEATRRLAFRLYEEALAERHSGLLSPNAS